MASLGYTHPIGFIHYVMALIHESTRMSRGMFTELVQLPEKGRDKACETDIEPGLARDLVRIGHPGDQAQPVVWLYRPEERLVQARQPFCEDALQLLGRNPFDDLGDLVV